MDSYILNAIVDSTVGNFLQMVDIRSSSSQCPRLIGAFGSGERRPKCYSTIFCLHVAILGMLPGKGNPV
jgi:hypothetical protein